MKDTMVTLLPEGFAPLNGLLGLVAGVTTALAASVFTDVIAATRTGVPGVPSWVLPLFDALVAAGWGIAVLAPAWYWIGRPMYVRLAG